MFFYLIQKIFGSEGKNGKKCYFYSVTLQNRHNFFFINLAISYIGRNKKKTKTFFFSEMQKFGSQECKPRNKKNGLIPSFSFSTSSNEILDSWNLELK